MISWQWSHFVIMILTPLTYPRSDPEMDTPLTKGDKNFLGHFQNYILHHHSIKNLIQHDWLSISAEDFEDHWFCHYLTILALILNHLQVLHIILFSLYLGNIPQWAKHVSKAFLRI